MKGISIRFELSNNWVFYTILTRTERLKGINSRIERKIDNHICLFDFDNIPLNEVMDNLIDTQKKYDLGEIFIFSDKEKSYRAICFKQIKFIELLKMLIDTKGIDEFFIRYTARKGEATIRTSTKLGRKENKLVAYISGKYYEPPKKINMVSYITKIGETLKLTNTDLRAGETIG